MVNQTVYRHGVARRPSLGRLTAAASTMPRQVVIGVILVMALFAFELFNFDTTRYALRNLLGDVRFVGLGWATILAVAFCAIDFAGLARLLTPERGREEPKEVWYLMGAWLLGATMNALMTWWAVSLTLVEHQLGNEVLSRQQLLTIVPVFVAVLVWLTRILFIGAVTVAGERMLALRKYEGAPSRAPLRETASAAAKTAGATTNNNVAGNRGRLGRPIEVTAPAGSANGPQRNGRVRQRPPRPGYGTAGRIAAPQTQRRARPGS